VSEPDASAASIAYEKYRGVRFFGSLDGLRALSILGVIWLHTWIGTPGFEWLRRAPVIRNGGFGVQVFFTISGFLITTLLLREREKHGDISLKDFYIRRALRIWPLYYAVLGLYIVLVLLTQRRTEDGRLFFHCLPSYLTYTYTWFNPMRWAGKEPIFNFAWSLSTEEQFYFVWPIAIKVLRRRGAAIAMASLIVIRAIAQFGGFDGILPPESLPGRILMSVSVPICAGALLACALDERGSFQILHRLLGAKATAPIALLLLAASVTWYETDGVVLSWVLLPIFVGACVAREDNGLAALLKWRPMAFIGTISYGMYLFNTLVVKAGRPMLGHLGIHQPVLAFPIVIGGTVLVSFLSYRYFETPFLKLKTRFERLRPPPGVVGPIVEHTPVAIHP
jgi:peptidoglycan/LPS O-acetylase OafA/YrhL